MQERLQKILSRHGAASRRQAEQLIEAGRVTVNGQTASLGQSADDETDVIAVDSVTLSSPPEHVYLMLNKPRGFIVTMKDDQGRRTAAELVADCGVRVFPVGRLDYFSEGLLLFTNDGAFADRMMHPHGEIEKEYLVWVSGYTEGAEQRMTQPIEIDGKKTKPAKVRLLNKDGAVAQLQVILSEGRNRQVRRLCEAAGMKTTRLCRVREGTLRLGNLPTGKWRYLHLDEIGGFLQKNA